MSFIIFIWIASSRCIVIESGSSYVTALFEKINEAKIVGRRYFIIRKRNLSFLDVQDARVFTCLWQFRLLLNVGITNLKDFLFLETRQFIATWMAILWSCFDNLQAWLYDAFNCTSYFTPHSNTFQKFIKRCHRFLSSSGYQGV